MITIYYLAKMRRSIQSSNNCSYIRSKSNYLLPNYNYMKTWSIHNHAKSYTQDKRFTSCIGVSELY